MELFKKAKNGNQLPAAPPISGTVRPPAMPRPARTFSEAAAEAAQHVIDLENKIHSQQDHLQNAEIRNNLLEEANKILHDDIARIKAEWEIERTKLKTERDLYHEQFMATTTSLQIGGKVILDALDAAKAAVTRLPSNHVTEPPPVALEPDMGKLQDDILDQYRPKGYRKEQD